MNSTPQKAATPWLTILTILIQAALAIMSALTDANPNTIPIALGCSAAVTSAFHAADAAKSRAASRYNGSRAQEGGYT